MNKIITISILAALWMSSCTTRGNKDTSGDETVDSNPTREELIQALAERDQLLNLVGEINQSMEQIKQLENILTVSNNLPSETDRTQEIQADINAIQNTLRDRREKLAALERRLSGLNEANAGYKQTIAMLKSQINTQTEEINTLKSTLGQAQERIGQLDAAVDSLNAAVTDVTNERNAAQTENVVLANELNVCYYAIGSKSELKDRRIIETGFLRKTKLLNGDFDQDFFTTADKRTLSRIALHSKKAEILTNQPEGSYVINDDNGQKVLVITNPDAFWSMSNYLVVKVD